MKKIFSILAIAALALTGCVNFAEDQIVEADSAAVPAIEVLEVSDNAIAATITSGANTSYYAYAVIPGEAKTLSASNLLKDGYSAVVSGVLDASKEASVTIVAEGLTPNANYTIYAVAQTKKGFESEIAAVTKLTPDSTIPALSGADAEVEGDEMILWAKFNDPVELTGEGTATFKFFAIHQPAKDGVIATPVKTVTIEADQFIPDGQWIGFPVPAEEAIAGAFVFLNFSEGIVVNGVGGKNAAYSGCKMTSDGPTVGIFEQYETAEWEFMFADLDMMTGGFKPFEGTQSFGDWKNLAYMIVPVDYETLIPGAAHDETVKVTYTQASGRTVSYLYDTNTYLPFMASLSTVGVPMMWNILTEAPEYGATVSFEIAAGAYEDIYGNENAAFEAKDALFYSYGLKLSDICGTYQFVAYAKYGAVDQSTVIIAPTTEDGFDVEIHGLFDNMTVCDDLDTFKNLNTVFYAEFDGDAGYLAVDYDAVGIGAAASYGWMDYVIACYTGNGVLEGFTFAYNGSYFELETPINIYLNGLGSWDTYLEAGLKKVSDSYALPSATAAKDNVKYQLSFVPKNLR